MGDFGEFYQNGGIFMHVISAFGLVAGSVVVRRLIHVSKASGTVASTAAAGFTTTVMALAVVAGVLATAFGFIEMCAALQTVPLDRWPQVFVRALPIAATPVVWSLLLVLPLGLIHGITRYAEQLGRDAA